jgi:hypothetical protein
VQSRTTHKLALLLALLLPLAQAQREERFEPSFDHPRVGVNTVALPPGSRVRVVQNTHDIVWIALSDGAVRFAGPGLNSVATMRAGDARLFRSFQVQTAVNTGAAPVRAAVIELKDRGLTTGGCGCSGTSERALCGCTAAPALPDVWAVGVGQITVASTTLAPGSGYAWGVRRNDLLLVAIGDVTLHDDERDDGEVKLAPGQAAWFPAARHRFRNEGAAPARFVAVEF